MVKEKSRVLSGNVKKLIGLVIMLVGLGIFLYPYYNIVFSQFETRKEVDSYRAEYSSGRGEAESERILKKSEKYNEDLSSDYSGVVDPFSVSGYKTFNKVQKNRDDIYGFIAIPKINEVLPIYLGADEEHLAKGAAQLAYTSLPIGGNSSRSVIAGHRGYYKKPMFRHLDKLKKGDKIYINVFDKTLVYKVYSTEDIYPSENDRLKPIEGKDIVTLLTCTPYPTNRMRLLVNCERTDDEESFRSKGKIAGSDINDTKDEETIKKKGLFSILSLKNADAKVLFTKAAFILIILIGTVVEIIILIKIAKTLKTIKNKQ